MPWEDVLEEDVPEEDGSEEDVLEDDKPEEEEGEEGRLRRRGRMNRMVSKDKGAGETSIKTRAYR